MHPVEELTQAQAPFEVTSPLLGCCHPEGLVEADRPCLRVCWILLLPQPGLCAVSVGM